MLGQLNSDILRPILRIIGNKKTGFTNAGYSAIRILLNPKHPVQVRREMKGHPITGPAGVDGQEAGCVLQRWHFPCGERLRAPHHGITTLPEQAP